MNDIDSLILVAAICIGIGFALGSLVAALRNSKAEIPPVPDMVEVAHLLRDRRTGDFFPEIGGKVVRTPGDLSASQRNRLQQALNELQAFLSAPAVPAMPVDGKPAHSSWIPPASAGSESRSQPGLNPIDVLSRAVQAETKVKPVEKSIAAQIDEILQEKLEVSPLQGRAIRLMELPGKGMVVLVGLDQYDGVDAVPDPEIRDLIRACVAEWEKKE